MFLLVPAHPGFPGQIPQSRKTVVCVCKSVIHLAILLESPAKGVKWPTYFESGSEPLTRTVTCPPFW